MRLRNDFKFGFGIETRADGEDGIALTAITNGPKGVGILATSNTGLGIYGSSQSGRGVLAESHEFIGLHAKGDSLAGLFEGDIEIKHKDGSDQMNHGLRLENDGTNKNWWNFHVADGGGHLFLFSKQEGSSSVGNFSDLSGSYFATSDRRVKKNFEDLQYTLPRIQGLSPKKYHFKSQEDHEQKYIGLIAQEVNEIFPELVSYDEEADLYSMDYATLSVVAIKAIQELSQRLEYTSRELESLKNQILKTEKYEVE